MADPRAGNDASDAALAALFSGDNAGWVEALFEDFVLGRADVPASWQRLFESLGTRGATTAAPSPHRPAEASPSPAAASAVPQATGVTLGIFGLVDAYRTYGHLIARLNPLEAPPEDHPFLDPAEFGLTGEHMDRRMGCGNYRAMREGTPRELIASLRRTYCGTLAIECMEIRDKVRRDWLLEQVEPTESDPRPSAEEKRRILTQLIAAERMEQFLHKRFLGQKRFSIEGGEALIPMIDTLVEHGAELGAQDMVFAMAHRGRLNFLTHVMGMPYAVLMREFQPGLVPMNAQGSGDVKYHRGYSSDRKTRTGKSIHLSLCSNPSHLEWINPVAEGITRAKQNLRGDTERLQVIPVQIHGDSAFTGQGIVPETLALSELDHYWTGGTIHIIVNNQIGFTTIPKDYRFTQHPSDLAKMIQAPVLHVNADDPEACVLAARIAVEFRQRFREDVVIDLVCYRRHGHNEGDDPTFTQPLLYHTIGAHDRVGTIYTQRLLDAKVIDSAGQEKIEEEQRLRLERALEESTAEAPRRDPGSEGYHGLWTGLQVRQQPANLQETSASKDRLHRIARALSTWPEGFTPHPKMKRLMEQRTESILSGEKRIDWGTGEALALGSLLHEGTTIRITGQDVERGTFSSRHAVLHDVETGARHVPLASLAREGANLIIGNSMLSEAAVLGFEYGYSTVDPQRLAIWEAQFGDFANTAQVIIDQFIASAETKWSRSSGLVMLLPHGYEGQGPEHSSARLERYLQLCAEDNLQVCNLTTPAQYFHALRRQIHRGFRKPLVLMSPKSLLRNPLAVSALDEFSDGTFAEVIDDPSATSGEIDRDAVRRVILCSGKVYYTLLAGREDHAFLDIALVRVEQLHPFPFESIRTLLGRYGARDIVWCQEEPWNMGAWSYVRDRLQRVLPKGARLHYVGRPEAASPAVGSYTAHEAEEAQFVREAFARRSMKRKAD